MDLHGRLDRRFPRSSYVQKILVVALVATRVPLLALAALAVAAPGELSRAAVLVVALVATLAGSAGLLGVLHLLLQPVRQAAAALEGCLAQRALPDVGDTAGV